MKSLVSPVIRYHAESHWKTSSKASNPSGSQKKDFLISPYPRLVSVLWYVPISMEWQIDRVRENGGDIAEYMAAIATFTAEIQRILGVP